MSKRFWTTTHDVQVQKPHGQYDKLTILRLLFSAAPDPSSAGRNMQKFHSWQGLPGWMPWSRLAWRSSRHWPPSQFQSRCTDRLYKALGFASEGLIIHKRKPPSARKTGLHGRLRRASGGGLSRWTFLFWQAFEDFGTTLSRLSHQAEPCSTDIISAAGSVPLTVAQGSHLLVLSSPWQNQILLFHHRFFSSPNFYTSFYQR